MTYPSTPDQIAASLQRGDLPNMNHYQTTIPWTNDELLYYRGVPLCYTVLRGGTVIVHFPAGRKVALAEMDRREVIEPRIWRSETHRKKEIA